MRADVGSPSSRRDTLDDHESRFLCLAVSGDRSMERATELAALYQKFGDNAAWTLATKNQVLALVAAKLADAPGLGVPARWTACADENGRRVAALVSRAQSAARALSDAGVRHAVVEGGGTLLASQLAFRAFCPGDLDILVDDMGRALDSLTGAGFVAAELDTSLPRVRRLHAAEDPTLRLEVMSCPYERKWVPFQCADPTTDWLERSVESQRATPLCVLHPSDALANVAIHTSLHSYIRPPGLRLHVDMDRLVRDNRIDWTEVVPALTALGVATRAFIALSMTMALLGTPVPPEVLAELSPNALRAALIRNLLSEGVFVDGHNKLRGVRQLALELALADTSLPSWVRNVVIPDPAWVTPRFGQPGDSPIRAQLRRTWAMIRR